MSLKSAVYSQPHLVLGIHKGSKDFFAMIFGLADKAVIQISHCHNIEQMMK
jgi:hypothetical protein